MTKETRIHEIRTSEPGLLHSIWRGVSVNPLLGDAKLNGPYGPLNVARSSLTDHPRAPNHPSVGQEPFRARERHRKKIAGYTTSSITVEVMTPPTIGVAMRFITSAPAPWLQRIGSRPAMMTAAVIALGRTRLTAPC